MVGKPVCNIVDFCDSRLNFFFQSLTGGTGDVNPQYLTGSVIQSAADVTTTLQVQLPIQRIASNAPNQAVVFEVLKVFVHFPDLPVIGNVAETEDSIGINFATRNAGANPHNFATPAVFAFFDLTRIGSFTAAGTYAIIQPHDQMMDITDGVGHGILIATDSFFVQAFSAGTGAANTVRFRILYRWKRVKLTEYIGIVQTQQ